MRGITKLLRRVGRGLKFALGALFAVAVLWCIVYRAFLGFTPPWLDEVTIGMTVVIFLVSGILKLQDGCAAITPPPDVADSASVDTASIADPPSKFMNID